MNNADQLLKVYGQILDTLELSPFELHNTLSIRDELEQLKNEMTNEQRKVLYKYDLQVINNADVLAKHIGEIWDFEHNKNINEWYWHLDKVAAGKFDINIKLNTKVI